jgi:hypothetical protein
MIYINCCKCEYPIKAERVLFKFKKNEEIICGSCIKKEQGEDYYNMWRDIVNSGINNGKT